MNISEMPEEETKNKSTPVKKPKQGYKFDYR